MLDQLAEEKRLLLARNPGSGTLISNLVRASEAQPEIQDARGRVEPNGKTRDLKALSVDEILGNIFVFNFAGHDTTAISLAYSLLLLVAHSEAQNWIAEELNFYLKDGDCGLWKYEEIFPKLKRCLAILLETLRLYNPLPSVPKYTGNQPQTLQVRGQRISIPAETLVVPNLMALQTHPRYWGPDSLIWKPSRWILQSSTNVSDDLGTCLSQETLLVPQKGSFIAWSEGVRNCPGKKFAQVEFVATMAALFREFRAEPVVREGETSQVARQRVLEVVKDSNVELLLQMRNPESVSVKWSRR